MVDTWGLGQIFQRSTLVDVYIHTYILVLSGVTVNMVPQQNMDGSRSETPTNSGLPIFGSQLVDKNSSTPYSDATQVGLMIFYLCGLSDFSEIFG